MPRKRSEPAIEMRRYRLADGTQTETFSVRYVDGDGKRRRTSFPTLEEADFERARLLLEQTRAGDPPVGPAVIARQAVPDGSTTLAEFWQVWLADARRRLSPRTLENHEAQWRSRVGPAFGDLLLVAIRPRLVAQWRAALLAEGVGPAQWERRWACCRRCSRSRSSGARPRQPLQLTTRRSSCRGSTRPGNAADPTACISTTVHYSGRLRNIPLVTTTTQPRRPKPSVCNAFEDRRRPAVGRAAGRAWP